MKLRAALLDRIHDKEVPVRVQAVIGLSKLSGSEEPSEVVEGEQTVAEVLIDTLAHDPSPYVQPLQLIIYLCLKLNLSRDVRRAVLLNIPLNPTTTLAPILARSRDTDTTIRKLVYSAILEPNTQQGDAIGTTHPRALTIAQREVIVRNGLGDREPSVRAAAGTLVGTWVDVVGDSEGKVEDGEEKIENGVVALLKMFDLGESTVAEDALLSVFATRVDIFDNIEFGSTFAWIYTCLWADVFAADKFWSALTPETAFLARVFVEHCIATKDEARLEAALPVVTALAFRIQTSYNDLLDDIQAEEEERVIRGVVDDDEMVRREDERINKEFVISEMLKLAVNLDYADEIGRRKMFQLVRK
jgi:condensin complex subunit 3